MNPCLYVKLAKKLELGGWGGDQGPLASWGRTRCAWEEEGDFQAFGACARACWENGAPARGLSSAKAPGQREPGLEGLGGGLGPAGRMQTWHPWELPALPPPGQASALARLHTVPSWPQPSVRMALSFQTHKNGVRGSRDASRTHPGPVSSSGRAPATASWGAHLPSLLAIPLYTGEARPPVGEGGDSHTLREQRGGTSGCDDEH